MTVKKHRSLLIILLLCILVVCSAQIVYGDGECDPVRELKASFDKGVAAEKSGKLVDAFEFYGKARFESACDGKNPVANDAKNGWKRVGQRAGAEEEKKGNLYKTGDLRKGAGAFQWFETSENFADADLVMMKMAMAKSEDMDAFKIAFEHFRTRKDKGEDLKKWHNYTVDLSPLRELENMASKNGDNALKREEKDIVRSVLDAGGTPVGRSIMQLTLARQWFTFFKDVKEKQVVERAEKRGDTFYADDKEPQSLEEAIEYYKIANNQEKTQKVKDKANRLAGVNEKEGVLLRAVHYYRIAGNNDKAEQLEKILGERGIKQQKEMIKDEKQQKKFKKEQEDLEKELGI